MTAWHTDLWLLYWLSSLQKAGVSWGASPAVVVSHLGFWHCLNGLLLAELSTELRCARAGLPVFCLKGVQLLCLAQMQPEASSRWDGSCPCPQTAQWHQPKCGFSPPCLGWVMDILFYLWHSVAAAAVVQYFTQAFEKQHRSLIFNKQDQEIE